MTDQQVKNETRRRSGQARELLRQMPLVVYVVVAALSLAALSWSVTIDTPKTTGDQTNFKEIGKEILRALGQTGFVAAVVAGFIGHLERRQVGKERDEYIDEIQSSVQSHIRDIESQQDEYLGKVEYAVFDAVLKRTFGRELIDEIKRQILTQSILRKDCHLVVRFDPIQSYPGLLKVTTELRYYLKNLSTNAQRFELRHSLDDPLGDQSARYNHLRVKRGTDEIDSLDSAGMEPYVRYENSARVFAKQYNLGPEDELFVEVQGEKIQRKADQYVWHTYLLVHGFRCTTHLPAGAGIELFHEVLYPEGYVMAPEYVSGKEVREWTIRDRVLLPYQGIQLRWVPLKTEVRDISSLRAHAESGEPSPKSKADA